MSPLKNCAKCAFAIVVAVSLTGCGSGSDDPVEQVTDEMEETADEVADEVADEAETGENTEESEAAETPEQVQLFGPPEYVTSDCGSLTIAPTASTNSIGAPAQFFVGEPVRGQIVPDSLTDDSHVWEVALEPGNYHLIADAYTVGTDINSIGLGITTLGDVTDDNEQIIYDSVNGHDIRVGEYLEIRTAQTLKLSVRAVYDLIHNYSLGIFRNGTAIPSPGFERCLPIATLSLGTTESVDVPARGNRDDELWYSIFLESGAYQLDATMSSTENSQIGFSFTLFDGFGVEEDSDVITYDTVNGTVLTTNDTFELDSDGQVWLRLNNVYTNSSRSIEFTVNEL